MKAAKRVDPVAEKVSIIQGALAASAAESEFPANVLDMLVATAPESLAIAKNERHRYQDGVCEEKIRVLSRPSAQSRKLYERELMQFCGLGMREATFVIAGNMTSVLQVADTDQTYHLKRAIEREQKDELRRRSRLTVGAFEMLDAMAGHDNVENELLLNDENKLLLNDEELYEIENLGDIVMGEAEIEIENLDDTVIPSHDQMPYLYREIDNLD